MLDILFYIGIAILAGMLWSQIMDWFKQHKVSIYDYGELHLKERLASGQYKVVSGVFDAAGNIRTQAEWVVDDNQETRNTFQNGPHVKISI